MRILKTAPIRSTAFLCLTQIVGSSLAFAQMNERPMPKELSINSITSVAWKYATSTATMSGGGSIQLSISGTENGSENFDNRNYFFASPARGESMRELCAPFVNMMLAASQGGSSKPAFTLKLGVKPRKEIQGDGWEIETCSLSHR